MLCAAFLLLAFSFDSMPQGSNRSTQSVSTSRISLAFSDTPPSLASSKSTTMLTSILCSHFTFNTSIGGHLPMALPPCFSTKFLGLRPGLSGLKWALRRMWGSQPMPIGTVQLVDLLGSGIVVLVVLL